MVAIILESVVGCGCELVRSCAASKGSAAAPHGGTLASLKSAGGEHYAVKSRKETSIYLVLAGGKQGSLFCLRVQVSRSIRHDDSKVKETWSRGDRR